MSDNANGSMVTPTQIDRLVIGDNLIVIDSDGMVRGRIAQARPAAREFVKALEAEIRALRRTSEPQTEPTDAQVQAALNAFYGRKAAYLWDARVENMRAALRAAYETKEAGQ